MLHEAQLLLTNPRDPSASTFLIKNSEAFVSNP